MNIHEYQAKAILREFGIPVAAGVAVTDATEAGNAAASLRGPIFAVKAQIHAGGRGKGKFKETEAGSGGGVRLARSREDVEIHARQMLGHTLVTQQTGPAGKQVNRLYIEDGSAIEREFYLALLVDRQTSRVAFVASTEGGVAIEEVAKRTPEKIVSFCIDPATGVMPHHGRTLAKALGLSGDLAKQAEKLAARLYAAFLEKDMALLEINPLVLGKEGLIEVPRCQDRLRR